LARKVFSIDTSSLIDLDPFPFDLFSGLWRDIENAVSAGELIASAEVYRELEKRDDMIFGWAKSHKDMFKDVTEQHILLTQEILRTHKNLVDIEKGSGNADPFVVALGSCPPSVVNSPAEAAAVLT
jgi:hypothetical protein